ncbi:MAG: hypothetical protein AB7I19_13600 [Planctomycetota bacterium]
MSRLTLDIDSDGGEISAVTLVRSALERFRAAGKQVEAQLGREALGGALWIATTCDSVSAGPQSMVGELVVRTEILRSTRREEGLGIDRTRIESGVAPEADRFGLRSVIGDIARRVMESVAKSRPRLDQKLLSGMGDGFVYSAEFAWQGGLVDTVALPGRQAAGIPNDPGAATRPVVSRAGALVSMGHSSRADGTSTRVAAARTPKRAISALTLAQVKSRLRGHPRDAQAFVSSAEVREATLRLLERDPSARKAFRDRAGLLAYLMAIAEGRTCV